MKPVQRPRQRMPSKCVWLIAVTITKAHAFTDLLPKNLLRACVLKILGSVLEEVFWNVLFYRGRDQFCVNPRPILRNGAHQARPILRSGATDSA